MGMSIVYMIYRLILAIAYLGVVAFTQGGGSSGGRGSTGVRLSLLVKNQFN